MDKCCLLIDFGASRVKAAIYQNMNLFDIKDFESVKPYDTEERKFVVSLKEIESLFRNIISEYSIKYSIDEIYICSEMHGFAVLDENNKPISDYISWKDERCLKEVNGKSSFEYLKKKYGNQFFNATGMQPRPCYPFFNLYEYFKYNNEHAVVKVVTLPEFLCTIDGNSNNIAHITMSAGLGLFNIYSKKFDKGLTNIIKKDCGVDLMFNAVTEKVTVGGYIEYNNKIISIYTGVGDHQCAVLGAGNSSETISINLGTGSQVGLVDSKSKSAEKRPFFYGKLMSVVTHIPSGRAFNSYIRFLNEINPNIDYWKLMSELKTEDIDKATLDMDLAVFSSAWNYKNAGIISNINEYNLTLHNFLASLLKNYLNQYEKAIDFIGEKRNKIILSGGIAQRIPVIKEYFASKGYNTLLAENKTDETFLGLCIIIDKSL